MGFWAKGVETPDFNPAYDGMTQSGDFDEQRWKELLAQGVAAKSDPYWTQQLGQAKQNQYDASQQSQQAYDLMRALAMGGNSQAQDAIRQGVQTQQGGIAGVAHGAGGGARGAAAAGGNVAAQQALAGIQGNAALDAQRASDMINGQRMAMGLANDMRGQDQRHLSLVNDNNFSQALNALGWRGLNDQNDLFWRSLLQNKKFGDMGFEMDRNRMRQDQAWKQDDANRANVAGTIGAVQGAAKTIGDMSQSDSSDQSKHIPTSETDDYINSDEGVKREVRRDAYEEGWLDAHQKFGDIWDLMKNKKSADAPAAPPSKANAKAAPAPVPTEPTATAATAKVEPSQMPAVFAPLVNALQQRPAVDPTVDRWDRSSAALSKPEMPPEFGGLLGALQQPSTISSDERQKVTDDSEEEPFLRALAKGRASYRYTDEHLEPNPNGKPGGRYLGVMAQELRDVPGIGSQLVNDSDDGLKVHVPSLVSALAAGTGDLFDRNLAIEERVARLERRRKK